MLYKFLFLFLLFIQATIVCAAQEEGGLFDHPLFRRQAHRNDAVTVTPARQHLHRTAGTFVRQNVRKADTDTEPRDDTDVVCHGAAAAGADALSDLYWDGKTIVGCPSVLVTLEDTDADTDQTTDDTVNVAYEEIYNAICMARDGFNSLLDGDSIIFRTEAFARKLLEKFHKDCFIILTTQLL